MNAEPVKQIGHGASRAELEAKLKELNQAELKTLWGGLQCVSRCRYPRVFADSDGNDLPDAYPTRMRTGKKLAEAQFGDWQAIEVCKHASGRSFAKIKYCNERGVRLLEFFQLGYYAAYEERLRNCGPGKGVSLAGWN